MADANIRDPQVTARAIRKTDIILGFDPAEPDGETAARTDTLSEVAATLSIKDLGDVATTEPTADQVLGWNDTNSRYEPVDESGLEQSEVDDRIDSTVERFALKSNADTIPAARYAAGGIGTTKLADEAVTTAKIDDGAVTTAKIDDAAVTLPKIADRAVGADKIDNTSSGVGEDVRDTLQLLTGNDRLDIQYIKGGGVDSVV